MFGNDDSVKKIVGRALEHNDQIKIYNHLISTYIERDEIQVCFDDKFHEVCLHQICFFIESRRNSQKNC